MKNLCKDKYFRIGYANKGCSKRAGFSMKITIVAATKLEVQPLLDWLKAVQISENIYNGKVSEFDIHLLVTGMGILCTSAHLMQYALEHKEQDLYIDLGICGAFNRQLKIGEVVHVVSETYGDFGVEDGEEFVDFFDMGFIDRKEDAFQYGYKAPYGNYHPLIKNIKEVSSITVNKVHGSEKTINNLLSKYRPDIENMEGLAFFYVLTLLKKPCIEIRSISNYMERRNKENWEIALAVKNLNDFVIRLLSSNILIGEN